ncbi:hypothetical protein NIES4071_07630 [Calothrix sp. NIES-4071]|nr:hypothetical protein NIES4071_07630 [Calothrix sp. NIES-4071]BAZ55105.1 hypothetical protein NIES4105_07590 [Calothrix sp. NIES-4105]
MWYTRREFQHLVRVRLETEAISLILERCETGEWELLSSEVIDVELAQITDPERKQGIEILTSIAKSKVELNETIQNRAISLQKFGIKFFDSLHIACAEAGKANVMLTVDYRLLRKTENHSQEFTILVANPVTWLMEIS